MSGEHLGLKGKWRFALVDPSVTELIPDDDPRWGEWIENMIVSGGDVLFAQFLNYEAPTLGTSYIAVGTGAVAPAYSDTQLGAEVARVAVTYSRSTNVTTFASLFPFAVANTTLLECGVFVNGTGAANSGTMINRAAINETKTSSYNLLVQVAFTFS